MRRTILLAIALAGCGTQPQPMHQPTKRVQAQAMPQVHVAKVGKPDCARLRDPRRMGERGTPTERCFEFTGYLDDKAGRAVYAEPDAGSQILGRVLGPFRADTDYAVAISFEIIDGQNGWVRIRGAGDDPQLIEARLRKMYDGTG